MSRLSWWRRELSAIAFVSIAPAVLLASHETFVHASVLDPSEPLWTSNDLRALGALYPWWVVDVPAGLTGVTLLDRLSLSHLAAIYLVAVALTGLIWTPARLFVYSISRMIRS